MSYRIEEASPVGCLAFDSFSHVSREQAAGLERWGCKVAMLYAELATAEDLANCIGAGLAVTFILEGLAASTIPTEDLGARMARDAVARMRALGVPDGASYAIDLEGNGREPGAWVAFANGAADVLAGGGDLPVAYVGAGLGLSSGELYALRTPRYWRGMSRVVDREGELAEPSCGWCAVQQYPDNLAIGGAKVDVSVIGLDFKKRGLTAVVAG
jgi:hypothetical protein